jgi:hypothetical protein
MFFMKQILLKIIKKCLINFALGPPVCFPSELIWNYGFNRQSVRLLGRGISHVSRLLLTQDNTDLEKRGQSCMPPVGFKPTIALFEPAKTFRD